ncbi:MAG: hypothetical protein IT158_19530 [Bryobacterales bacterium]|nr:hypothetical protein [Bryobacterales bacterium]
MSAVLEGAGSRALDGAAAELVRAELERILASPGLSQSESLARLLRHVVTETLAGRAGRIKEYTLGVEVFQRGAGFDPKIDTIVRSQARRLRAKLADYYVREGAGSEIVFELPKGTYVPVFRRRDPVRPRVPSGWPWHVLGGVLVLTVSVWLFSRLWSPDAAGAERSGKHPFSGIAGPARLPLLAPGERRPEAYRLYLKARMAPGTARSMAWLDEALRADPELAPAWLARAESMVSRAYSAEEAPARIHPLAREAALRAVSLGHHAPAVYRILGEIAGTLDWDWEESDRMLRRALELDRENSWSRLAYAQLLVRRGAAADALEQLRRLGAADGSAPAMACALASVYFLARQYDHVIEICQVVSDSVPGGTDCHYWMGRALLATGRPAEALVFLEKRRPGSGQGFGSLVSAYLAAGRGRAALRIRAEAEDRAARAYVSPVSLAQAYFAFGDLEAGFRELERGIEVRDHSLATLKVEPAYDGIRGDPRFQRILRRLRL